MYDNIFSKENPNSIYNIVYEGKIEGNPRQRLVKSKEENISYFLEGDILKIIFEKEDDESDNESDEESDEESEDEKSDNESDNEDDEDDDDEDDDE